ncbi:hypothetical protein [Candidatus Methanocrinis natronophilus]|uniref:Uncharacterized protein n=1 Tax=Candidatus Methanocrinis natronophilus TaxID=3033396 RepID=A0ABT5X9Q1_9EURY|nr:hypothetical protein [Candidatus Methanocrinis natronophilus]MDF0591444.1 hypothetical protein [Candidatus Methanocrinis natronophilus]
MIYKNYSLCLLGEFADLAYLCPIDQPAAFHDTSSRSRAGKEGVGSATETQIRGT